MSEEPPKTPYHIGHVIADHSKDALNQLKAKVTGQAPEKNHVEWANQDLVRQRLLICLHCEKLNQKLGQCTLCNCLMSVKAKYAKASCPLNKW